MSLKIILLSFAFVSSGFAQSPLGIGVVEIEFDASTVVEFYEKPADQAYARRIEFFDDKNIGSWNIKDLDKHQLWLKPEVLWLDYSQFKFRCKSVTGDWLEVIVNNQTGRTYWIRRTAGTAFIRWEEYLQGVWVNRLAEKMQPIRKQPAETAPEIPYQTSDCFRVRSVMGEWMEIFSDEDCESPPGVTIKSGWIRWRRGNELLIDYYAGC